MISQKHKWTRNLEKFLVLDKTLIKDKECIICLESLSNDVESATATIIMLPCKCANSSYHIACIIQLLMSGQNKNFCPHCRTNYDVSEQQQPILGQRQQPILDQPILDQPILAQQDEEYRYRKYSYIFIVHIISNSIMNIINISMIGDYDKTDANIVSKLLVICYFFKLLINCVFIFTMKRDADRLEKQLTSSYLIQVLLFVLLVSLLSTSKINFSAILLLANNITFSVSDSMMRICLECRNRE